MFGKDYYDFIYGTIHLDKYAENQADALIQRFGIGRYLDVGCGCGICVKALRDRGCEAWGLEISDYAISESHIPEFVKRGSMENIPFPDNYFDVVFSRVSIGYTDDLLKVISELRRVGGRQCHTIDMNCIVPAYGYKVIKPEKWWVKNFPENEGM